MKAETRKMAALANLCLQKNALLPVTATEILEAFQAMETAMEIMLARNTDAGIAKHDLYRASRSLTSLLCSLAHSGCCIPLKQRRLLENRIKLLQQRLNKTLSWFCC